MSHPLPCCLYPTLQPSLPTLPANPPQSQFTGQSMETITRDTDRDFFMSPQEAIEYGLIDAIISKPQVLPQRQEAALIA